MPTRIAILFAAALLAGCATQSERPTQEMTRAQTLIDQAEKAGAQRYAAAQLEQARAKLDEARQAVTRGNVSAAHGLLHAFGNQIAAQSGGTIEPGAANILLADVQYVAGAM